MIVAPDIPVFRAIADPTRRAILDLLVAGERAVNDLLAPFKMSQPAISQHLKVLRDAGLVSERRDGRQRIYKLEPAPLKAVHDWTAHYEQFWMERFAALGDYLDAMPDDDVKPTKKAASKRKPSTKKSTKSKRKATKRTAISKSNRKKKRKH